MGKPKAPKPPPPPPPPAPEIAAESTEQAADETIAKARKRSGYQKTILTGALSPSTGKKTVLG